MRKSPRRSLAADAGENPGGELEIVTQKQTTPNPLAVDIDISGRRLLIVDDDEGARRWLSEVFTHVGCSVKEAASGLGALDELAENGPFHLVVTDVYMPAPSGLQLVAMARTTGYEGPFLLVTAFPDRDMLSFARNSEGTDLLVKPFTADDILQCAAELLA